MENTALQFEKVKSIDKLLPARGPNIYDSGIKDREKAHVKYGPASSDQPILLIPDPIYDEYGNGLLPGYYELMLSQDRQNLLLAQKQIIVAIIPVFKIEEDRSQELVKQPRTWISQKKYDRKERKKEKKIKKLIKEGKMSEEPEIYNNASIKYEQEGYYLIKYERGKVRAWGALKI